MLVLSEATYQLFLLLHLPFRNAFQIIHYKLAGILPIISVCMLFCGRLVVERGLEIQRENGLKFTYMLFCDTLNCLVIAKFLHLGIFQN